MDGLGSASPAGRGGQPPLDDDRPPGRRPVAVRVARAVAEQARVLPFLATVSAGEPTPLDFIDALTVSTINIGDPQDVLARAWFDHAYRFVSLQPGGGVTQTDGRGQGWIDNTMVAEGLGDLIDLELEVRSVTLDFANQAVLGASQLIDETDPRFALMTASAGARPRARSSGRGSSPRCGSASCAPAPI